MVTGSLDIAKKSNLHLVQLERATCNTEDPKINKHKFKRGFPGGSDG